MKSINRAKNLFTDDEKNLQNSDIWRSQTTSSGYFEKKGRNQSRALADWVRRKLRRRGADLGDNKLIAFRLKFFTSRPQAQKWTRKSRQAEN